MTVKLGKVIQVDVRKAWPNEAAHFTPWLASADSPPAMSSKGS